MAEPRLIIYKKILSGDIEKLNERSNITQSGGGARDFRFNPPHLFVPIFLKMFPKTIKDGTQEAIFHWLNHPATKTEIDVRMDKVRKEVRICKVSKCLFNIPTESGDYVFILIKNTDDEVWPYFVSEETIREKWEEKIATQIMIGLNAKRSPRVAAAGYIDLETGECRYNGE